NRLGDATEGATVQREGPVAKEGRGDGPEGRAASKGRKEGTTVGRKQGSSDHSKEGRKEGAAIIYRNSGGIAVVTRKTRITLDLPVSLALEVLVDDAEFQHWIQRSMFGDSALLSTAATVSLSAQQPVACASALSPV
ncbi:hypothetical protein V500_10778, partial [Pseudogymnoascus sp. VKM F-4518 (FW-2643)]